MKCFGATDTGLVRPSNQDSYVIATNEAGDVFAMVADGIGGGNSGDVASQTAVQYFSDVFSQNKGFRDEEEALTWLKYHIRKANEEIFCLSTTRKDYKGMGTTLVGILMIPQGCYVVNVGDSRGYATLKDGSFIRLTQDHTLVQEMLSRGEITEEQMKNHPKRNMLTNALGIWSNIRIDCDRIDDDAQILLLCSDGLHGYVQDEVIAKVLRDEKLSLQNRGKQLMNLALFQGGYDNITIILIQKEAGDQR